MVLITSFKSSSLQDDDHSVNYGPILSEIEEKAGYSLEWLLCYPNPHFEASGNQWVMSWWVYSWLNS